MLPSKVQVNCNEFAASFICWPITKAWAPIVSSNTPLVGLYAALVTSKLTIGDLPTWRSIVPAASSAATTSTGASNALSTLCVIPPVTADTNVCASKFVDGTSCKHWISKVSVVVLETGIQCPLIGSVERGYVFSAAAPTAPPNPQLNVNESSAILTHDPSSIPWPATVIVTIPVLGLYAASVAVNVLIKFLGYDFTSPVLSISQVNLIALSAILTVSPTEIPCPLPMLTCITPVVAEYVALVTSCCTFGDAPTLTVIVLFVTESTGIWVLAYGSLGLGYVFLWLLPSIEHSNFNELVFILT